MQQERQNNSADSSVSEFAKERIAREKERLAAMGVTIPHVDPEKSADPTKNKPSTSEPEPYTNDATDGFEYCYPSDKAEAFDDVFYDKVDYSEATPEQKKIYDDTTKGIEHKSKTIRAAAKRKTGSVVVLNPYYERKRKQKIAAVLRIVVWLCFTVAVLAVVSAIDYITSTHTGDRLKTAFLFSDGDDREFYERFESFENYVTLGDSAEKIEAVLGTPDRMEGTLLYYGDSYLIVEENRVVGFYRDPTEALAVTLGFQGEKAAGKVLVGDSAQNVVYRLGTPDYCFYQNWLYLHCNGTAETVGEADTNFEVNFNEQGIVVSCHELKR